jgi:hypothetical protein
VLEDVLGEGEVELAFAVADRRRVGQCLGPYLDARVGREPALELGDARRLGFDQEDAVGAARGQDPGAERPDPGPDLQDPAPDAGRQLLEREVAQPPRPREVAQVPEPGVRRRVYDVAGFSEPAGGLLTAPSPFTTEPGAVFGGVTVEGSAAGPTPLPYGVAGSSSPEERNFFSATMPPPAAIGTTRNFARPLTLP